MTAKPLARIATATAETTLAVLPATARAWWLTWRDSGRTREVAESPGEPCSGSTILRAMAQIETAGIPVTSYAVNVARPTTRWVRSMALMVGLSCAAGCASTPKSTCHAQSIADRWKLEESPYKEYFAAMKKAIYAKWDPTLMVLAPLGLSVHIEEPQHIAIEATFNSDGSLESQRVCLSSNHATLDDSAMNAIREAQPFGPVPTFLLDDKGKFNLVQHFHINVPTK